MTFVEEQRHATLKALPRRRPGMDCDRHSGDVTASRWLESVLRELASKAIVVCETIGPA